MTCVEKCSKPVICAFHGYCIGAALDLGSACDIRLASEDAKISLREAAVSIIADVGVLQRLPHIVGQASPGKWPLPPSLSMRSAPRK